MKVPPNIPQEFGDEAEIERLLFEDSAKMSKGYARISTEEFKRRTDLGYSKLIRALELAVRTKNVVQIVGTDNFELTAKGFSYNKRLSEESAAVIVMDGSTKI